MAHRCGVLCDEDKVVVLLAKDPEELAKYKDSMAMSYVEDNAKVQFCPGVPWCGRAVQVSAGARLSRGRGGRGLTQ